MLGNLGYLKTAATEDKDLAIAVLAKADVRDTVISVYFPGFQVRIVDECISGLKGVAPAAAISKGKAVWMDVYRELRGEVDLGVKPRCSKIITTRADIDWEGALRVANIRDAGLAIDQDSFH